MTICVFDVYGTLFDVNAAARLAAQEPGNEALAQAWPRLASDWRQKQLQYTWLRAVAGRHCDFWQVTQDGLDWALEAAGLDDPVLRENLLALYWRLPAFPEVPYMLARLAEKGHPTAILSNGSPAMLSAAVSFAGIGDVLHATLSVEEVGIFKPASAVYDMVNARFGGTPADVLFVSSNGWDAAGGAGYGFRTVWVNRAGDPLDRLYATPTKILTDLTSIPELA